jgi:methyl-accepting chemotaxis protein
VKTATTSNTALGNNVLASSSNLNGKLMLPIAVSVIALVALTATLWVSVSSPSYLFIGWTIGCSILCLVGIIRTLQTTLGELLKPTSQLSAGVRMIADGNLVTTLKLDNAGELAQVGNQLDRLVNNLSITVANIRNSASVVAQTGNNLTQSSNELSERTCQQAAALEQTASSLQEMTQTVMQNSQNAQQANKLAATVRSTAQSGEKAMRDAVETMHIIQTSSKRMSEIVAVIEGIAFQTNILALNAAVEAARAGEQGKSFAVVASEVSTLAHRSAQAAKEIKSLISSSSHQISDGVIRVDAVSQSLQIILKGVQQVASQVGEISSATAEQSKGLTEISSAIHELDAITQQNTQLVEQSTNAAAELSQRAARIAQLVDQYRLRQGSAEEAMGLVHRVIEYANNHGVQAAADAVNDPKMNFHDRDMYVFMFDTSSKFLAWALRPEKVGTRATDNAPPEVRRVLENFLVCAANGGGWIEYELANPVTKKIEPKMTYVMPLDGAIVGCGVYRTEQMSIDM